jgi:hypothetical protein
VLILKGADKKNGTRTIWLAHEAEGLSPLEAADMFLFHLSLTDGGARARTNHGPGPLTSGL